MPAVLSSTIRFAARDGEGCGDQGTFEGEADNFASQSVDIAGDLDGMSELRKALARPCERRARGRNGSAKIVLEPHDLDCDRRRHCDSAKTHRALKAYTSRDWVFVAAMKLANSGCGSNGRDFSSG